MTFKYSEIPDKPLKFSDIAGNGISFHSPPTAVLEPNEVEKESKEILQIASDTELPVSQVEKNMKAYRSPLGIGLGPVWNEPDDDRTMHEILGYGKLENKAAKSARMAIDNVNATQAIADAYFKGGDLVDVLKEKGRLDALDPVTGSNFLSDSFYKGIGVAAPMAQSVYEASPYAFVGMVGGAIIGGIAGNLGGGLGAPEELITVPAGAKVGVAAATMFGGKLGVQMKSAEYWYRQGVGQMIYSMNKNGVDMKYAGPIAAVAGVPYAAIEYSQMSQLTPGLRRGVQDTCVRSMLKVFTAAAKKYGTTYVTENVEEVLQEGVQMAAEDLGNLFQGNDLKFDKEGFLERAGRLVQTSVETGKSLLLLPLPGAAVDIHSGMMQVKNKNKFINAVKEQIGVPRKAAVLAADMLKDGKSVKEVDQMLSQAKAGIVAEKTQEAEKAKIVPPSATEGTGTEIAPEIGKPSEKGRPTIVVPDKGLLVYEETAKGLTLQNIDVVEGERRKGVGTAMVRKAEEITGKKFTDYTDVASPEGKAFVEKVIAPPESKPAGKQPWEMTRDEYGKQPEVKKLTSPVGIAPTKAANRYLQNKQIDSLHKIEVQKALSENLPVPPEVLAEYPELKPVEKAPEGRAEKSQKFAEKLVQDIKAGKYKRVDTMKAGRYRLRETDSPEWGMVKAQNLPKLDPKDNPTLIKELSTLIGKDLAKMKSMKARAEAIDNYLKQPTAKKVIDRESLQSEATRLAFEEIGKRPVGINISDAQIKIWNRKFSAAKTKHYNRLIKEAEAKQPTAKAQKVEKKGRQGGFVDLTPIATAGEQVKTTTEKASKLVSRFGGLEPAVKKSLIEYEEQVRELPKVIANDAIEKFGKLTAEQERAIENHRENPKKHPLPEELKPHLEVLEKGIEEYGKRLEALGYPTDWPKTYTKRLEAMLQKEQAREVPNTDKIDNIKTALEEAKDLQYLHHYYQKTSTGKRIWSAFKRRISKKPTGVLGRKIPTLEKAEELGLKRAPLAVSYAHMAHEIARAEAANDLIQAINENPNLSLPEDKAPDEWVRLDERVFPASVQHQAWIEEGKAKQKRTFRKYPIPVAEALEELTYSRDNESIERAYDKLNFALKIIGFYNPVVMTKNDAVQLWRAAGIKGFAPLTLPQIDFKNISIKPPKAIQIFAEKGAEYDKLRKGGLFNNIVNYTPAVTEITEQMLTHIRETSGEKAARIIGEHLNPVNLIKNIRKYNDMTTWNMDEIMRIACYEAVKDSPMLKGMTDFEKIEWANDAMVNYAKMPKSTKRWLSKGIFVPTYRVGNFRYFWGEASKVYQGQWRHMAPIARTAAYKLFVKWGLPAIVSAAILYKTGEERDVKTEKGYRLVIHNPDTNADTVYALSDPLLEGAKLTQRTFRHTLALNLAPLPSLLVRVSGGPRFKQSDDPFGEFFKLGTPLYRDILNWKDKDKTVPQKILTQLAIAFVYTRRGREQDKEKITTALAKTLSIWTDWKEQASDIKKMVYGRDYYLGSGGKFGRLFRQYNQEQDEDRAEIDSEIDSLMAKGHYEKATKIMLESGRYESAEGVSGRIMSWRAPLFYYWETMSKKDRTGFINWLSENKHYSEKQISELTEALESSLKDLKIRER